MLRSDASDVHQGLAARVLLENVLEEGAGGDEDKLVNFHLLTIIRNQGHICKVFAIS